jgi:hypothetical protein
VLLLDDDTGTTWDFSGLAVRGPLAGQRLRKLPSLTDYWFDWKTYHQDTDVFALDPADRTCTD